MNVLLTQTTSEHAGLTVRTVGPPAGEPVEAALLLCHGFGAPGTDLVGLAAELFRLRPALVGRARVHFPAAPHDLAAMGMPGARAWWMLNMNRLNLPPAQRVAALRRERPEGIDALRTQLDSAIDSLLTLDGLPSESLVVGGFSQGAMLTTDYALRTEGELGGLAILSGAFVAEDEWSAWAATCPSRRVFQSHGTADPILPYESGEALRDLLTDAGHTVRFEAFPGPHTIPPVALEGLADLLEAASEA
ncbi:alpha/beta hydrolase [Alienimonas californiensis]|uniref:Phospholipase/Carboxylesterase n=1 Tax=Alienimonas californiensis TaxID=2527989 RepID=A0A517PBJ0_9PLAN|nr:phospholipase [Alienimonas californiensis]QDT16730.1 Phospholipase/Carboxylesterase [Alienimonas californiensis]